MTDAQINYNTQVLNELGSFPLRSSELHPIEFALIKRATYLPDEEMPYHGRSHPHDVWAHAEVLIGRCKASGIDVDVHALERAVLLHDALGHLDPRLLGFSSAEHMAASLAHTFLLHQGFSPEEAQKVSAIIMATNPQVRPKTNEEIIMRAADLWNLGAPYAEFESASRTLHRECELRSGKAIEFNKWLAGSYSYLQLFMWPMLELTAAAKDGAGRSVWHTNALRNLVRLWKESQVTPTAPKVVAELIDEGPLAIPTDSEPICYIGLHGDEPVRESRMQELRERLPKGSIGFIVYGAALALSLPDGFCDEVVYHHFSPAELREGTRVLTPQGALRLLVPGTFTAAEIEQHARSVSLMLDTIDHKDTVTEARLTVGNQVKTI